MENLDAPLTVTLAEFGDPDKLIANAGNRLVVILDQDKVLGYFVPKGSLDNVELRIASENCVIAFLKRKLAKIDHVIDYLRDK